MLRCGSPPPLAEGLRARGKGDEVGPGYLSMLPNVAIPVLAVAGGADPVVTPSMVEVRDTDFYQFNQEMSRLSVLV
eukprot:1180672-Prorocentrum_minimum.AAC.1